MIAILYHIIIHKPYLVRTNYDLPSGQVQLWELDCKEGRVQKNWCLQTVVLETTLESALDSKKIKPVNPKGNQPWIFIGRTDAEAEAPVIWSHDGDSRLIEKVSDTGKDWGHKEQRVSEDEMAGWHHWFSGHELGKVLLGDGEGQEAWHSAIHWVTKCWTRLSDWTATTIVDLGPREPEIHQYINTYSQRRLESRTWICRISVEFILLAKVSKFHYQQW